MSSCVWFGVLMSVEFPWKLLHLYGYLNTGSHMHAHLLSHTRTQAHSQRGDGETHRHTHTHTHIHTPTPQSYLITLKKITGTQFWQLPTIPHTGGDKPWSVLEGVTPASHSALPRRSRYHRTCQQVLFGDALQLWHAAVYPRQTNMAAQRDRRASLVS